LSIKAKTKLLLPAGLQRTGNSAGIEPGKSTLQPPTVIGFAIIADQLGRWVPVLLRHNWRMFRFKLPPTPIIGI
jgi:hypothetical protein